MSLIRPALAALAAFTAFAVAACVSQPRAPLPSSPEQQAFANLDAAAAVMSPESLLAHISTLASDAFEGRKPGTPGEEKTVAYITEQFKALGLAPGNPNGSYTQPVGLMGITSEAELEITAGKRELTLVPGDDFVAVSSRFRPDIDVKNVPLVFVGYGVQAPEYGWDDYKGVDVSGKAVVMLINDPPVPDPANPEALDPATFKGRGMTYYGRWTYKYEIASQLGAAAVFIVHETEAASYPWGVVKNSWTGEQFELDADHRNLKRVPVQGWLTLDKARKLMLVSGQSFEELKDRARTRDFRPVPLDASLTARVRNTLRSFESHNVAAVLPGRDPALKTQHIIYTAHWDHLGRNPAREGDQIYNGAVDNASGVAGLFEIAKAFKALPEPPRRSVMFLAVTAEEQGLLGSRGYVENPLVPIADTVATINMDALNPLGLTRDIQVIGSGQNTLEDTLAAAATRRNRVVVPDAAPERGGFYRSDQFEFAKKGVPGLYAVRGDDYIGKSVAYGRLRREQYVTKDYHEPSDEVKPDWDLRGMVADLQLLFETGERLSADAAWPRWKDGSEFKAIRESAPAAPP